MPIITAGLAYEAHVWAPDGPARGLHKTDPWLAGHFITARSDDTMTHDYDFKTEPYAHQREAFNISRDAKNFALLMDMGTGKTKVGIDTAAWLWSQAKIGALVVIAPNGVHRNWINREVPVHLPEWTRYRAAVWASSMLKKEQAAVSKLFDTGDGLRVVAMNVEAFGLGSKSKAAQFLMRVLNTFDTLVIIDESTVIKSPKVKRTKTLITLGKKASYKRIMTGTPINNGPMDAWAQFAFLDTGILGFDNFYSYKHHFGEWQKEPNRKLGIMYETLVAYRNLDELTDRIKSHSFRVTKGECVDLPAKVFKRVSVELTKEQKKLYSDIRSKAIYELSRGEVTVQHVLTKLLRLQQVIGGFLPAEEGATPTQIPGGNPRLDSLLETVREANPAGKVIIWARFRAEIDAIAKSLAKEYGDRAVVEYHGGVAEHDREESIDRFQNDPTCNFFVGNQRSGGMGLTLTAGATMLYYSNDFSLFTRLQSEDRAHRIGQKHSVLYVDFEAESTVDSKIIAALRSKKDMADTITMDDPTTWL